MSNGLKLKVSVENGGKEAVAVMDAITQGIKRAKEQTKLLAEQSRIFARIEREARQDVINVYRAYEEESARVAKQQKADYESVVNSIRKLDLERRRGLISADQQALKLLEIKSATDKLVLSESQRLSLEEKLFHVNQRTIFGFTSMSGSLHNITQASNRSQQAFMSLAYIIQDMPYGIRGVANNITQLSQVLGTPIWLNLAISAFTSLAVVMDSSKIKADNLNESIIQLRRRLNELGNAQYRGMLEGDLKTAQYEYDKMVKSGKYNQTTFAINPFNPKQMGFQTTVDFFHQDLVSKQKEILDLKVKIKEVDEEDEKIRTRQSKALAKELKDAWTLFFNLLKLRNAEREWYGSTFAGSGGVRAFNVKTDPRVKTTGWQQLGGVGTPGALPDIQATVAQMNADELKEAVNTYNTVFFDPLRAGFKAIGDEIRTSLFGSLEDMKAKFGNVAAAILDSLSQVIAKLIETAIAASLLSFLFPGAGGFGTMFKNLIMPGQLITPTNNGVANSLAVGGGAAQQMITVQVVGQLKGGDIYLSGKQYEAMQMAARV